MDDTVVVDYKGCLHVNVVTAFLIVWQSNGYDRKQQILQVVRR